MSGLATRAAPLFVGAVCVALGAAPSAAGAKVDYGPISHKGFTKAGIRKMIARLHEELAIYEGSEEARQTGDGE